MFKWHSGCANKVLQHDLAIVQRGIAASMRDFSISAASSQDSSQIRNAQNSSPRQTRINDGAGARENRFTMNKNVVTGGAEFDTSMGVGAGAPLPQRSGPPRGPREPRPPGPAFLVRRTPVDGRDLGASGQGPQGGGQRLLLKRNNFEGQRGRGTRGRRAGRGGRGGASDRPRRRRREEDLKELEANAAVQAEIDAYFEEVAPDPVPHEPVAYTLEDLRKDWPAMPAGAMGLTEGVEERVRWLARRLPHGYNTHKELAQRLCKGEMVHFESAEEKAEVLRLAETMAKDRAEMLSERKGEVVEAEDMGFADISKDEKTVLVEKMVKGVYPELEAQKLPFLNQIVRSLRNNETYHEVESRKFMDKIESMLPGNAAKAAAGLGYVPKRGIN